MVLLSQQESIVEENNKINNMLMTIKGKRSKRSRLPSPSGLPMSTSPTDEGGSSTVSEDWTAPSTEEEEDMARCLILLAQGPNHMISENIINTVKTSPNSNNNNNNNNNNTTSYECKTCNRTFPSFQALGGHRTSHKKIKLNVTVPDPKKPSPSLIFSLMDNSNQFDRDRDRDRDNVSLTLQMSTSNSSPTSVISSKVLKVHECSICGAEFSSGQALGGHMRRHRPLPSPASVAMATPVEKTVVPATKNFLSLDLNLPAPEEEHSSKFVFGSNEKTLVFTATSLVDCHY